jgi:hypothetical protein
MTRWYTVTPLHNLKMPAESRFDFGAGVVLGPLPSWICNDPMVEMLSTIDRQAVKEAAQAFIVEYEAASLGDQDPSWKESEPKSIQETKYELGVLGNLALWLSRPSAVCSTVVMHAPQFGSEPAVQQITRHSPFLCHPKDVEAAVSLDDISLASKLHLSLVQIPRQNAIWTAIRAACFALQMNTTEIRYSLWWIALEALFGPEDAREITHGLSQRIGFFLGENKKTARELFARARKGYTFRSKVVHGRWKENPETELLMADAETSTRRSLLRILQDAEVRKTFLEKNRETYLDDLVFSS